MGLGLGDIVNVLSGIGGDNGGMIDESGAFGGMPDQGDNEWNKLLQQSGAPQLTDLLALGQDQGSNEWAKLLQQNDLNPGEFYSQVPLGNTDPITGIGWIDKILHGVGNAWDKNPLGVISGGLGILSKIDAMRGGNESPGRAQMSSMVNSHVNGGANAAPLAPVAAKSPYGASAGQLIAIPQVKPAYTGPLTNTFYNGRK